MSKTRYSILALACLLVSCSSAETLTEEGKKDLSQQITQLGTQGTSDAKGETNTEDLLYLLNLPTMMKSATLVVLDGQLETLKASGRAKEANELSNNRQLLLQAMDENMEAYVEAAAKIYDETFTTEEIARLIEIYKDPVMTKTVESQLEIQQKIIPFAEEWGQKVGVRYEELLSQKVDSKR